MEIAPNLQPTEQSAPARPGEMAWTVNPALRSQYAALYAPIDGERFPIPAVELSDINPEYLRKAVYYSTQEQPGTIIIDPTISPIRSFYPKCSFLAAGFLA